jgi:peptidyl-prolyl cis-trans isomerase B (cyclophilin B)
MRWVAGWLVLVAACAASETRSETAGTGAFARIAQLEDARWGGDGELAALAEHADAKLRVRAVRALGRMPWPEEGAEITRALLTCMFDPDASVRAEAAFALGMRGDPSAGDKLVFVALDHHEADKDALVRARAVEALSKLERPDLHARLLDALEDSDPRVRLEAAQGAARWPATAPNAGAVDERLVARLKSEEQRDVVTYLLFALERRKASAAIDTFVRFSTADDAEQRLYAVRGLRAFASEPALLGHLWRASTDGDARVACEALLALGNSKHESTLDYLLAAAANPRPSVRRCAWEALGAWTGAIDDRARFAALAEKLPVGLRVLESFKGEPSSAVRAAMLTMVLPFTERLMVIVEGDSYFSETAMTLGDLRQLAPLDSLWIAVAKGLADCRHGDSVEILASMTTQPSVAVRGAAVEALAKHPGPATRKVLLELLNDGDNGVRLAAAIALAEMLDASDVAPLAQAYDSTRGDGAPEVRFNVLQALAKLGGDGAKALARRALFDDDAFVRRTARNVLDHLAKDDPQTPSLLQQSLAHRGAAELARRTAAVETRTHRSNPFVAVVTTRGTLRFELFPDEAPLHVENLLRLAERDYFDGLTFHRVVPDFVVQGGCYRGDGNGGGTWRGREDALRHEITPRKYVRGSLGMPRYDDLDSGGSQFFVTHRSTPHLDGRYTIFGELREGFDVLDALEVGDVILDVIATE